ncbi:MAG: sigma-70 family RNA polymerase sigma factor [Planctomycetota bacterium]
MELPGQVSNPEPAFFPVVLMDEPSFDTPDDFVPLWNRYRDQLRRFVECHLDARVRRRVSESDILQEALIRATNVHRNGDVPDDLPTFCWLRRITRERIIDAHRRHRQAARRTVAREHQCDLNATSVMQLADRMADRQSAPSASVRRAEQRSQLHLALQQLDEKYREVLQLRFLEELSLEDAADAIGISREGIKSRQRRAIEQLVRCMGTLGH